MIRQQICGRHASIFDIPSRQHVRNTRPIWYHTTTASIASNTKSALLTILTLHLCRLLLLPSPRLPRRLSGRGPPTMAIHVAQVPARLNHVPHTTLQLLDFGEPALGLAVPQQGILFLLLLLLLLALMLLCAAAAAPVRDGHGEDAARGGLQRDLADGQREGGEQLLCELYGTRVTLLCQKREDRKGGGDSRRRLEASTYIACRT